MTQHHELVDQPLCAWEVGFAELGVVWVFAMSQRHYPTCRLIEDVDVVKLVLLNVLHMHLVLGRPHLSFTGQTNYCGKRVRNWWQV